MARGLTREDIEQLEAIGVLGGGESVVDDEDVLVDATDAETTYQVGTPSAVADLSPEVVPPSGVSAEAETDDEELQRVMEVIDPPWWKRIVETAREYGKPFLPEHLTREYPELPSDILEGRQESQRRFKENLRSASIGESLSEGKQVVEFDPSLGQKPGETLREYAERRPAGEVTVHEPVIEEPISIRPKTFEEAIDQLHWALAGASVVDPTLASDAADAALYKIMGDPETAREVVLLSAGGLGAGALAMRLIRLRKMHGMRKTLQYELEGTGMSREAAQEASRDAFEEAATRAATDAANARRGPGVVREHPPTQEESWWRDLQKDLEKLPGPRAPEVPARAPEVLEEVVPSISVSADGKWKSGLIQSAEDMPDEFQIDELLRYESKKRRFRGMLANQKGVSEGEIRATNLDDFLDGLRAEGRDKVTRDEVLNHLKENRVEFGEVRLGESPAEMAEAERIARVAFKPIEGDLTKLLTRYRSPARLPDLIHRISNDPEGLTGFFDLGLYDDFSAGIDDMIQDMNNVLDVDLDHVTNPWDFPNASDEFIQREVAPIFRDAAKSLEDVPSGSSWIGGGWLVNTRQDSQAILDAYRFDEILKKVDGYYDSLGGAKREKQLSDEMSAFVLRHDAGLKFWPQRTKAPGLRSLEDEALERVAFLDPNRMVRQPMTPPRNSFDEWATKSRPSEAYPAERAEFDLESKKFKEAFEERRKLMQVEDLRDDLESLSVKVSDRASAVKLLDSPAGKNWIQAKDAANEIGKKHKVIPTIGDDLTLQEGGGANYREILITKPTKAGRILSDPDVQRAEELIGADTLLGTGDVKYGVLPEGHEELRGRIFKKYGLPTPTPSEYLQLSKQEYDQELNETLSLWLRGLNKQSYTEANGSHWPIPDVFVHLRLTDQFRFPPSGGAATARATRRQRILLIEELQSDINQQGRTYGHMISSGKELNLLSKMDANNARRAEIKEISSAREEGVPLWANERNERIVEVQGAKREVGPSIPRYRQTPTEDRVVLRVDDYVNYIRTDLVDEYKELSGQWLDMSEELHWGTSSLAKPGSVFQSTDEWVQIGVRRAMQIAAEEGYDGVAVIGGRLAEPITAMNVENKKTRALYKEIHPRYPNRSVAQDLPVRDIDEWLRFDKDTKQFSGVLTEVEEPGPWTGKKLLDRNQIAHTGIYDWINSLKAKGQTELSLDEVTKYLDRNMYKGSAAHIHYDLRVKKAMHGVSGVEPRPLDDLMTHDDDLAWETGDTNIEAGLSPSMAHAYEKSPPIWIEFTPELRKKMLEPQPLYEKIRIKK